MWLHYRILAILLELFYREVGKSPQHIASLHAGDIYTDAKYVCMYTYYLTCTSLGCRSCGELTVYIPVRGIIKSETYSAPNCSVERMCDHARSYVAERVGHVLFDGLCCQNCI